MKAQKPLIACLAVIICVAVSACGPVPFSRLGGGGGLQVSFVGQSAASARGLRSRAAVQIQPVVDETYYKDSVKEENRGDLLASYTPANFILDIDDIAVYNAAGNYNFTNATGTLLPVSKNPEGGLLPTHYDLVYARNIIQDVVLGDTFWQGLITSFLPSGSGSSSDNCYVRSVIAIDLGADYAAVDLPWELLELRDGTVHYFGFDQLQPFSSGNVAWLIIGSDVETAGIQNPGGIDGFWPFPGGATSGNMTQVFYPGPAIDLSGFVNPSAVFYWDMVDLVQVYEGPTGSRDDDVVTFRLDNPFPVELVIQESLPVQTDPADSTHPGEVLWPVVHRAGQDTSYPDVDWNTLQWINPNDKDFATSVIVRKVGSAPVSTTDGTTVYEGYTPIFVDESIASDDYFYTIFTVDVNGNTSAGTVFQEYVSP